MVGLVVLLALAGCQATADEHTARAAEAVPNTDVNIAVVEAYADVWAAGEVDLLEGLFTEHWAHHESDSLDVDVPAYKEYVGATLAAFLGDGADLRGG